ncbi:MAG: hypothetical protein QM445_09260, partial [Thermotogota bacterium]|nr:hypothetical protein [Thermotogota bacterium]
MSFIENRYVVEVRTSSGYLLVDSVQGSERAGLSPFTGSFRCRLTDPSLISKGQTVTLELWHNSRLDGGSFVETIAEVEIERVRKTTNAMSHVTVEAEFKDKLARYLEQETDILMFSLDPGLTPAGMAQAIYLGTPYEADVSVIIAEESDMRARDFQFSGSLREATIKLERILGARTLIDHSSKTVRFIPDYYDSSSIDLDGVMEKTEIEAGDVSSGVKLTGFLNTIPLEKGLVRHYNLRAESWSVILTKELYTTPSDQQRVKYTGKCRTSVRIDEIDRIESISTITYGFDYISLDHLYTEEEYDLLEEEPSGDPIHKMYLVWSPESNEVSIYRTIILDYVAGSSWDWGEARTLWKMKKFCEKYLGLYLRGNVFKFPVELQVGPEPREHYSTNEPASAVAALRLANLLYAKKSYQKETKL